MLGLARRKIHRVSGNHDKEWERVGWEKTRCYAGGYPMEETESNQTGYKISSGMIGTKARARDSRLQKSFSSLFVHGGDAGVACGYCVSGG